MMLKFLDVKRNTWVYLENVSHVEKTYVNFKNDTGFYLILNSQGGVRDYSIIERYGPGENGDIYQRDVKIDDRLYYDAVSLTKEDLKYLQDNDKLQLTTITLYRDSDYGKIYIGQVYCTNDSMVFLLNDSGKTIERLI